jgi:hypothetical protein
MLYRDPVIGGELLDDPLPAEAANAAVLLSAKRTVGTVVRTAAVDMRHPVECESCRLPAQDIRVSRTA